MPKSSIATATPRRAELLERRAGARDVGDEAALGDLHLQRRGGQRPAVEQPADQRGEVAVEQAARGQVDRDAQLEARRRATRGTGRSARSSTSWVSSEIRSLCSASADEPLGRDEAELRVLPAHERLDAVAPALAQRELRLVVHDELAALDAAAQLAGEREAVEAVRRRPPARRAPTGRRASFAA